MKSRTVILVIAAVLAGLTANAYNLRQSYNVDGLPNSAILSMSVDGDGLLWIGTCDGVSIADGLEIVPFNEMYPGLNLSGNLIEHIFYAPEGVTWIQTNHGLDRFSHNDGSLTSFPGYKGSEFISVRDNGDLFLLSNQGQVYTYTHDSGGEFHKLVIPPINFRNVLAMSVRGDSLMIVDHDGASTCRVIFDPSTNEYSASGFSRSLSKKIKFATVKGSDVWAIDNKNVIGRITPNGNFEEVVDASGPIERHGVISDIISDRNGNIYISFTTNGVVCLNRAPDGYSENELELKVGVFSLARSDKQDVVWIGSDCQGVYTLSNSDNTIRTVNFSDLDKMISHPIRAIYLDSDSTLWLGTKGSGILRIDNFNEKEIGKGFGKMRQYTTANSSLHANSVFAFHKGANNRLWMATDNGLNFYDYKTGQIKRIPERGYVNTVYDIHEVNDTTLLLATLGNGIIRVNIGGTPDAPVIINRQRYVIGNGERALNYFFSISDVPGQGLIASNRGLGAFRLENDSLVPLPFKNTYNSKSVYDIFTAVGDSTALWLGSGNGLVRMGGDGEKLFSGVDNGFQNNTIHDILKDRNGDLWISTNRGLVKFNPTTEETLAFTRDSGLGVSEFSDGAGFATDQSLIFGGVDGFVVVSDGRNAVSDTTAAYMPDIQLQRLNILGKNANISDYLKLDNGEQRLTLSASQNQFSVTFCAPDFIDAANYTYYYRIDNDKDWISNGSSRTITFNELGYGTYKLYVKYANRMTGVESRPYKLLIKINAPWYLSAFALTMYLLMIIAAVIMFMYYLIRRQKSRQKDELKLMEYTHREQVYEEKLRFFTNITHEFSTPLTLIYGPCERILTYAGADDYIRRYVGLIRTNAERLNNLIQELIDFRRIETGHKKLKIHSIDISGLCKDTLGAYAELAETNHIDLHYNIADNIVWNSDFGSLRKVLNNLISNAFKYTPVGGKIEMDVSSDADRLTISVYNTGKGIREEDKEHIFNRYAVLDNVEENAVKGLSNRNGLGLAICHSIVEMLKGTITIESVVGEYAKFIVTLPPMEKNTEATDGTVAEQQKPVAPVAVAIDKPMALPGEQQSVPAQGKQTVLVIDDNQEILALLSDSLNDYNVITASSADEGLALVTQRQPDLIITDVMMPGTDGFELTRQIKSNIHTRYIPIIILSAKNSTKERVDGIESGADVYIGKPFSLSYLLAVIKRLLEERTCLREYYNSSASAYEYSDGRLRDRQSRDIMDKAAAYVDSHLDDGKLSPEALADYLQISLRNLYRKFKELGLPAPNDFIKNQRMAVAAKLLLTTSDTVQEIMYRTGFTNRSHFYKEFGRRYGMTPGDYRAQNRMIDDSLSEK